MEVLKQSNTSLTVRPTPFARFIKDNKDLLHTQTLLVGGGKTTARNADSNIQHIPTWNDGFIKLHNRAFLAYLRYAGRNVHHHALLPLHSREKSRLCRNIRQLCRRYLSSSTNTGPIDLVNVVSLHGHTQREVDNLEEFYSVNGDRTGSFSRFGFTSAKDMTDQVDFGIIFDIDGVIGRGATPFAASKRMIQHITDKDGNLIVPIAFCTNSTGTACDKAKRISDWLDVKIKPEQMIAAQQPLSVFNKFHDKRILFVGQGKINEMAEEMGFTNVVTIDEVKEAFPLLDIVDHGNRHYIAKNGISKSHSKDEFQPIEAVILIGEPTKWETHLQLLVDLLVTGGHPSFAPEVGFPKGHIPILACNMDLVFMAEACMPRFGHGAFLVCLESLYKKITGRDLQYTALIGKPSEITMRYSEHCIARNAVELGIIQPIKTLYLVGDNPEVDIFGANLYSKYIEECLTNEKIGQSHSSRQVPSDYEFTEQTATKCHSVLVGTGVYDPKIGKIEDQEYDVYHHGHRDFEANQRLRIPTMYCSDVNEAVLSILERELCVSDIVNNNEELKKK